MNQMPTTTTLYRGSETLAQYANPSDERFGGLALLGGFVLGNMMGNMNCQNGGCGGGMFGGGGCGCGRPRPMPYYQQPMMPMAPVQQFQQFQIQPQPQYQPFQTNQLPYQQPYQQQYQQPYPTQQQAMQPIQPLQPIQPQQQPYAQFQQPYQMPASGTFTTNKFYIQR